MILADGKKDFRDLSALIHAENASTKEFVSQGFKEVRTFRIRSLFLGRKWGAHPMFESKRVFFFSKIVLSVGRNLNCLSYFPGSQSKRSGFYSE